MVINLSAFCTSMPHCIPTVLTSVRDCSSRTLSFDELLLVSFSAIYIIKINCQEQSLSCIQKNKNKSKHDKKKQIEISNNRPCAGNRHVPGVTQVDHPLGQEVQRGARRGTGYESLQFEPWIYTARGCRETTHLSL